MKERQQNFELLRIIAMFMIVISHVTTHYIMADGIPITGANEFLLTILRSLIYVCVNVYIIITGYFSIYSKQLKLRKISLTTCLFLGKLLSVIVFVFCSFPTPYNILFNLTGSNVS